MGLAEASVTAVAATVESAEADSNAGSVVIRVAIIGSPNWTVDRIAGSIVRRRPARSILTRLLGLIVAGPNVAEGLRRALGRDHDGVLHAESENLFRGNVGRVTASKQHA